MADPSKREEMAGVCKQHDLYMRCFGDICVGLGAQVTLMRRCVTSDPDLSQPLQRAVDGVFQTLHDTIEQSRKEVRSFVQAGQERPVSSSGSSARHPDMNAYDLHPFGVDELARAHKESAENALCVRFSESKHSLCDGSGSSKSHSESLKDVKAANRVCSGSLMDVQGKVEPASPTARVTKRAVGTQSTRKMSLTEAFAFEDEIFSNIVPKEPIVDGAINPNWGGRLCWDVFLLLIVMSDIMIMPFQLVFKDEEDAFDVVWLWFTTTFFLVDLLVGFLTAYVAGQDDTGMRAGRLVTNKWRIAEQYFVTWFPTDLLSTIPWTLLANAVTDERNRGAQVAKTAKLVKVIRFLRLIRMARLAKLRAAWERMEAQVGSFFLKHSLALARVILVMFVICHWNACMWWHIGTPDCLFCAFREGDNHWTRLPHVSADGRTWTWASRSIGEQYIFSVYWTLGVMRTMPAEVTPQNLSERLYVMFFMFFAFSAFAICIALITQTFFKFSERARMFEEDMSHVRMYMRGINADPLVQSAVKNFLAHLYKQRRVLAQEGHFLRNLPQSLSQMLKAARLEEHIAKLQVMQGLPHKAVFHVASITEVRDIVAGTCLCRQGRFAEAAWVLVSGALHYSGTPAMKVLEETPIHVVDEETLASPLEVISQETCIASLCSEVARVDKKQFFDVITSHEDFRQVFRWTMMCGVVDDVDLGMPPGFSMADKWAVAATAAALT